MIHSMTGFGSASATADGVSLGIELRSVNSRHLKLNFRIPPGTERWEESLREVISSHVKRGHVDITLRLAAAGSSDPAMEAGSNLQLDEARVEAYLRLLRGVQEKWGLGGEIDIGMIARNDRLLVESAADPVELITGKTLERIVTEAALQLVEMRQREGERLAEDLQARVSALESRLAEVEALAPDRLERETGRLRQSINDLARDVEIDPDRIAREIAFIADKWDISEEIVRVRAHLAAFRELLAAPGEEPVGKRLGFLGQELLREVNTIGSKANDATMARIVVEMKNELESLREQNENVE